MWGGGERGAEVVEGPGGVRGGEEEGGAGKGEEEEEKGRVSLPLKRERGDFLHEARPKREAMLLWYQIYRSKNFLL